MFEPCFFKLHRKLQCFTHFECVLKPTKHPIHPICEAAPTPSRRRLRMVLEHPLSKRLSLYGMNGGTCRILPKEAQKNACFVRKLSWSRNCNIFGVLKRKGTYRKWRSKVNASHDVSSNTQRRLHFQHAGHLCEVFDWEYCDLLSWNFMSSIWLVVTAMLIRVYC